MLGLYRVIQAYMRIMEKKTETTIIIGVILGLILGLYRDNGKQNGSFGNYHSI